MMAEAHEQVHDIVAEVHAEGDVDPAATKAAGGEWTYQLTRPSGSPAPKSMAARNSRAARPIASRWSRVGFAWSERDRPDHRCRWRRTGPRGTAGFIHFEKMSCPK